MKHIHHPHITALRLTQMVLLILWGVACYAFFQLKYQYHFFYEEQNQLFLLSGEYIGSYLQKPAAMACLVGDFLTQFYYYMYAGAAILTLSLLLMGDVMYRSVKALVPKSNERVASWAAFCIAIIAMTICARLSLYEDYRLSSIIAIAGGCAMFWLMDIAICALPRKQAPAGTSQHAYSRKHVLVITIIVVAVLLWSLLTFQLFGYGFWFFFVLMIIRIPGLCKEYGLPQWASGVLVAISFIPLSCVIIPFAPSYYNLTIDDVLTYPGLGKWVNYDAEMAAERNLKYDNTYYFGRYSKVKEMYEQETGEPTPEMSFFYCLSLEQLGMLADRLPEMKNPFLGTFLKIDDKTPLYQTKMINELYYLLGDMTYTERAALLANTFSPNGRNVRMVKRLAEANLISGDTVAAMKYLRLLQKTLVYRQWAKDRTPGTQTPAVKGELERKQQYINTTDNIRIGDDCYTIMTQLLDSNPKNSVALDYLLCSDMLARQREVFIHDFEKYGPSPRPIFQQIYNSAKEQ